ncbi:MAG TPA: C45 family peptidase [Candidatus Competibacteraceae bacterium]|nr:C45 family peptidase [Candidatus Competibacteraceae bacterium]
MELVFEAIAEEQPGAKWQALFARRWPAYRRWFLSEGERARPYYLSAVRALRRHMPELLPTYERLVELAGGGDLAARFLSLYCPPPYISGCSQAVWPGEPPLLVRNYDYSPQLCEAAILKTAWNGRPVIAMSDCLWGVLDGMNAEGLAVSLAFGGRRVVGEGFGVPLLLRYILEFATTSDEAVEVLERVPCHMAYTVTVLDRRGKFATAYLAPDRPTRVRSLPFATNHQDEIEWERHARATATQERERVLALRLRECTDTPAPLLQAFLRPPLYSTAYGHGFGTLYTAIYAPWQGQVEYRWPNGVWRQSFTVFEEAQRAVYFPREPAGSHHP